jgi:D-glycero-D-manno-heptose 1,7-bisphosphate phosphatase
MPENVRQQQRSQALKLVILDRNGSINEHRDDFVKSDTEWTPLPGALEAIARLNQAGWHVVIASNQSGLGRGLFDVASLNAMHAKMQKMLATFGGRVDAIFYCPHSPEDDCDCRKPKPGLFRQIGERFGIDLRGVPTVGDSLRDLQAGAAAGCEPHLLLTGMGAACRGVHPLPAEFPPGTQVHEDLADFVRFLLAREDHAAPAPAAPTAGPAAPRG